ncbi:uncharacterized protein BP5553_07564 [Venustampulla echinocandica]|uniref:Uncharacterized protein n=1 Tax=Venustampulla echinocandica TaxID=2656787 RepID=A0A370TGW6_9HELO|nr:uncharacterized protein BP5553_07564 [Venustampulla echinocandica]RDL34436.1 hypothetical protein BP5553_07564 [Venustampulla echinocandica]
MKALILAAFLGAILSVVAQDSSGYGKVTNGGDLEDAILATFDLVSTAQDEKSGTTTRTVTVVNTLTVTPAIILPTFTIQGNLSSSTSSIHASTISPPYPYRNSTTATSAKKPSPTLDPSTIAISAKKPSPTLDLPGDNTASAVIPTGAKGVPTDYTTEVSTVYTHVCTTLVSDIPSSIPSSIASSASTTIICTSTRTNTHTLTVSTLHTITLATESKASCGCPPVTVTVTAPYTPVPVQPSTQTTSVPVDSITKTGYDGSSVSLPGFIGVTVSHSSVPHGTPCAPLPAASSTVDTSLTTSQSLVVIPLSKTTGGAATSTSIQTSTGGAVVYDVKLLLLAGLLALVPFI